MEKGPEREKSLAKEAYWGKGYFRRSQWESFRFQVACIHELMPAGGTVLEIGYGSGFVNAILRELGYTVESVDINEHLRATYTGDISARNYSLPKSYDMVLCAEVLEHVPFEKFDICLDNIAKLTNRFAVITLPNCEGRFAIDLAIGERKKTFYLRNLKKMKIDKAHFWEMNYADSFSNQEISKHIRNYFEVDKEGVVEGNPGHYFYILQKRK